MTLKPVWLVAFFGGLILGLLPIPLTYESVPEPVPVTRETPPPLPPPKTFDSEITRLAAKYHQSELLARAIISCESKQYGSGASHKNYDANGVWWSTDWGWWEINDYYNAKTALRRGFDIHNKWDNLEFGFIMLKEQGTSPWGASRGCWG